MNRLGRPEGAPERGATRLKTLLLVGAVCAAAIHHETIIEEGQKLPGSAVELAQDWLEQKNAGEPADIFQLAAPDGTVSAAEADETNGSIFPIRVSSENPRLLETNDGRRLRYMGDTPWALANKATQEEVIRYLDIRQKQGFNAIQMLATGHDAPERNIHVKNAYDDMAVTGQDEGRPVLSEPLELGGHTLDDESQDYGYFDHVDFIIEEAAKRNMLVTLVPVWYGYGGRDWGRLLGGPNAVEEARAFGTFMGQRFGGKPNVMWLMGGDTDPRKVKVGKDKTIDLTAVTNAMAEAIMAEMTVEQLMTYHPNRRDGPNKHFAGQSWYKLTLAYSDENAHYYVLADFNGNPGRPLINGEGMYDARDKKPILNRQQLRAQAYWTYLSGAVGFAYGHENVWDMDNKWEQALRVESAEDMRRLDELFDQYDSSTLLPDQREGNKEMMLTKGYSNNKNTEKDSQYAASATAPSKVLAMAYVPSKREMALNGDNFDGGTIEVRWWDPGSDAAPVLVGTFEASGEIPLEYPETEGGDALLIVTKK